MGRHELACTNRHACMLLLLLSVVRAWIMDGLVGKLLLLRVCMRACAGAYVIDTMYQLIYTSAQTRAWGIV